MMEATLAVLSAILTVCVVSEFTPVVYEITSTSQCDQQIQFDYDQRLMNTLQIVHQQLPPPGCNPPLTCRDILRCNSSASSGYYQIQAANGSAVQVYCDMEGTNCGGEGGWMRVAHLNMTDSSSQCPDGFRLVTPNNVRFCTRNTSSAGCRIIAVESFGLSYSQVCGYARGYSYRSPGAFENGSNVLLSGNYVDGVAITYGTPPTHIWTYAAGAVEVDNSPANLFNCPCNAMIDVNTLPGFWAVTTTVSLVLFVKSRFGTLTTLFGMVCSVEEWRDLVVIALDCPGSTRT